MTAERLWSAFLLLLLLLPLSLGGYSPWAWSLTGTVLSALVLLWAANSWRSGTAPVWRAALWPVLAAAIMVVVWMLIQLTAIGDVHPIWRLAADALGKPLTGALSAAPEAGRVALIRLLGFMAAFWLAFQYGADRDRAYRLLRWFAYASGIYALYGICNYVAGNEYLLWYPRPAYPNDVTGTFVNRNSYATFAGLGFVTIVALLLQCTSRSWREADPTLPWLSRFLELWKGRSLLYLTGAIVTGMALLQSHSRMGFLSTLAALLALLLVGRMIRTIRGRLIGVGLAAAAMLLLLRWSGDHLLGRLGATDTIDRLSLFTLTARAIEDAPLMGHGYGSFAAVLPMYRDLTLPDAFNFSFAHNSYLELAMEIGLPAAALFVVAVAWLVVLCLIGSYRRNRDHLIPSVAFAAAVLVGLHSLLDFSAQMPPIGCLFAALLGIGNAQAWSRSAASPQRRSI